MAIAPPSGLLMAVHRRFVAGERHRWEDFAMVVLSGRAKEFTECDAATET
jgi:hypothetical protein